MAKSHSFAKVEVGLTTTMALPLAKPEPGVPFRIAVLADFSGRANRGLCEIGPALPGRRAVLVDRDNLDEVIARHNVTLSLGRIGKDQTPVALRFEGLDDFHPDRMFERLEVFRSLRQTRKRLDNPATFAEAAAEVKSWAAVEPAETAPPRPEPTRQAPATEPNPLSIEGLFDQTLDVTKEQNFDQRAADGTVNWNALLREIVEPYSIPGTDPQLPELLECVDAAAAAVMRAILHHSDFQGIEAAWRAVDLLVRRVETDAQLKLYLLDISKDELAADLRAEEDLAMTGLYKLLVEQTVGTPGAAPWSLLAGNYTFDSTRDDAELLGRIGTVARQAGAPFIAAAGSRLLGCNSLAASPDPDDWQLAPNLEAAETWAAIRQRPEADSIGLAFPRFLLRLPYGRKTDPTEQFLFEELEPSPEHENYLWGNSAVACACLIAQAFSHHGWDLRPESVNELDRLPVHVYTKDGDHEIKPCGEVLLTERAIDTIVGSGLIPLVSVQGQDVIRLPRIQSIAAPSRPLAGRWRSP
jgi:type VI secretion system protein ImpC